MAALVLGAIAAFPSYFALVYRARTRLDDSLDVVAAHGLGGTVGALLTGVFASKAWNGTATASSTATRPARHPGARRRSPRSPTAASRATLLLKVIGLVTPLKVDKREEGLGLDVSQHGEEAYADDEGAILILHEARPTRRPRVPPLAAAAAEGGRS